MRFDINGIVSLPVSCSFVVPLSASYLLKDNCVPVDLCGTLTRTAANAPDCDAYRLTGTVSAVLHFDCESCLDSVSKTILFDVDEMFCTSGDIEKEIWDFSDHMIDVVPAITSAVILNLPMTFVCHADCKGLCPSCGVNLNNSTCQCSGHVLDPRFEKLRALFPQ